MRAILKGQWYFASLSSFYCCNRLFRIKTTVFILATYIPVNVIAKSFDFLENNLKITRKCTFRVHWFSWICLHFWILYFFCDHHIFVSGYFVCLVSCENLWLMTGQCKNVVANAQFIGTLGTVVSGVSNGLEWNRSFRLMGFCI